MPSSPLESGFDVRSILLGLETGFLFSGLALNQCPPGSGRLPPSGALFVFPLEPSDSVLFTVVWVFESCLAAARFRIP